MADRPRAGARFFARTGVAVGAVALAASLLWLDPPRTFICAFLASALLCACLVCLLKKTGSALLALCSLFLALAGAEACLALMQPQLYAQKDFQMTSRARTPPPGPNAAAQQNVPPGPEAAAQKNVPPGQDGAAQQGPSSGPDAAARQDLETLAAERGAEERFFSPEELVARPYPGVGYRPKVMASKTRHRSEANGTLIYDVVYSTLPSGWRVTPQHPEATAAVALFGCSFTWGDGLEDRETFAWKLGELLGPGYQVYNFAFSGYGSQHMAALIESGVLDDVVPRHARVHVLFTTMDHHPQRSAGYSMWDPYGPWYVLEDGRATRKGVFADSLPVWLPFTDALFGKSLIYRAVNNIRFMSQSARCRLHAGIVKEADRQLYARYGLRLTVALWPGVSFRRELEEQGLELLDLRPFFPPDLEKRQEEFQTHPTDWHPNARATDIVARALAGHIRQQP